MSKRILFLSVKPEYAEKIFDGTKKVELRRIYPNLTKGDYVLVYVSSPVKELFGGFVVKDILKDSPNDLWGRVQDRAGVSKKTFFEYYKGTNEGYAITFERAFALSSPISLSEIRKLLPEFKPPQGYLYLDNKIEVKTILHPFYKEILDGAY